MSTPIIGPLILQFVLILLNAFFACSEIAIITCNDTKLKRMAESGNKSAIALVRLTKQPARFLATIQVGITLAGFMGSAFAAQNFSSIIVRWFISMGSALSADTLETIVVIVITLILSYFTLVLGELVPKRIAMKNPQAIAIAVGRIIYFVSKVTAPLVWLLTVSTNGLLRLFRIDPHAEEENVTEEEIRIMVDLGEEKGTIEPEEGEMIDNVLELSGKTAVEIMTHRTDLTVLWLEDSPQVWDETILTTNYSRYPVFGEDMDQVAGVLHVRDYLMNLRSAAPRDVKHLLRPAYLVPETVSAAALLRDMKRNRQHMAVVVDEYGGTSGVITMEDVLEEIVGEINDEHDEDEPDIIEHGDKTWRMRGTVDIDTLNDTVGIPIPRGDYDTLGGLIFAQMNSIPVDGTHPEVDVGGLHIRVEELTDHRVEWAQISLQHTGDKNTPKKK